jgi:hypothetical protein
MIGDVCIPRSHPCKHDWRVARLTELLLMGHTWNSVRHVLAVSKPEFDQLLDDAVNKAQAEQRKVVTVFLAAASPPVEQAAAGV